ncbi:helix-turn-helix domain-containing protein [Paenibacillus xylanexedens]|uniref:Transcriptional regulator with XRE-family HTH domain n=1 Tax=Paenibacillus xylanexedens TaxID=528191 RepID=A0ABS4RLL7_PAEXY|nr:helix-turn-helix transcriptional regulator [Paenibacillus xylanexedens]MBP2243789.1 transcriptional regulator with XRE-family HTH domain [Paenibacillus xylanexedens]
MDIFSARLKWLREMYGFVQKDMADMVGMSPQGYGKIENGQREPNLETLAKLPELLGESLDFLLGVTDDTRKIKRVKEDIELYKNSVEFAQEMIANTNDQVALAQYQKNLNMYAKKLEDSKIILKNLIQQVPWYGIERPFWKDEN